MPLPFKKSYQVRQKGLTNQCRGQNCVPSLAVPRQVLFCKASGVGGLSFRRLTNRIALAFKSTYVINISLLMCKWFDQFIEWS